MYIIPETPASASPTRVIVGRSLAHRRLSASQRAALAAQVLKGEASIELSIHQLAAVFCVSGNYVRTAAHLNRNDRDLVVHGLDLRFASPAEPPRLEIVTA